MRGDELARQWRVNRAIEVSPNGLAVTEIAHQEEIAIRTINRALEAFHAAGFPPYTEKVNHAKRWAFIDKSKFKIPPPFTASHLISLYSCKDLVRVLRRTFSHDSIHSLFTKFQSLFSPQTRSSLDQIQSVFRLVLIRLTSFSEIGDEGYLHSVEE